MNKGKLEKIFIQSKLLRGNPMRNPARRMLMVYTPPGFNKNENLPCILYLPGFGSDPEKWRKRDFPAHRLLDLLILSEEIPRCILACVDGYTRLGGSQYLDSKLNGPFMSHIIKEIIPTMKKRFNVQQKFHIAGHSSGGFGALSIASLHPQYFLRALSFAGDMHFELTHKHMLAQIINDVNSGKLEDNLSACLRKSQTSYVLGLAAAYTPNLRQQRWKADLPIDLKTGEILEPIWKKWMALDPVEWVPKRLKALKSLDGIHLICGDHDQHALHIGADTFTHRCLKHGIKVDNQRYEGDHRLLVDPLGRGLKLLLNS